MGLASGFASDVYTFTATLEVCSGMTCPPKVSKGVGCQGEVGLASGFASDVYTFTATFEVCLGTTCPTK